MEFSKVQAVKAVYTLSAGKWVFQSDSILYLKKEEYQKFVSNDTVRWFRNLGSKQILSRSFTSFGYQVTKLSSYSPDGEEKNVYNFRFLQ